jgi:hypothetical protein
MNGVMLHARARLLPVILPWIVLSLCLILATEPFWSIPILGFNPALDALLLMNRCRSGSLQPTTGSGFE